MSRRGQFSVHANKNWNINKDFFKTNYWSRGCLNIGITRLVIFFSLLIFLNQTTDEPTLLFRVIVILSGIVHESNARLKQTSRLD